MECGGRLHPSSQLTLGPINGSRRIKLPLFLPEANDSKHSGQKVKEVVMPFVLRRLDSRPTNFPVLSQILKSGALSIQDLHLLRWCVIKETQSGREFVTTVAPFVIISIGKPREGGSLLVVRWGALGISSD